MTTTLDPRSHRRSRAQWDALWMNVAAAYALMSKDPDRKTGAVAVRHDNTLIAAGYNGLPAGVADDPAVLADKECKLALIVHAETNCILRAPRQCARRGDTLYVTRFPCRECARRIVFARFTAVVAPEPDTGHPTWGADWTAALRELAAARIIVRHAAVPDVGAFQLRVLNGAEI